MHDILIWHLAHAVRKSQCAGTVLEGLHMELSWELIPGGRKIILSCPYHPGWLWPTQPPRHWVLDVLSLEVK